MATWYTEDNKDMELIEAIKRRFGNGFASSAPEPSADELRAHSQTVAVEPVKHETFEDLIKAGTPLKDMDTPAKVAALQDYAKHLAAAGMTVSIAAVKDRIKAIEKRAQLVKFGYVVITSKQIGDFMDRKNRSSMFGVYYRWDEKALAKSNHLPPKRVLEAIKESKDREVFDWISVASVEHVPDPIVFGRINGTDDRFFIAQWGDDVCLDDII